MGEESVAVGQVNAMSHTRTVCCVLLFIYLFFFAWFVVVVVVVFFFCTCTQTTTSSEIRLIVDHWSMLIFFRQLGVESIVYTRV